MSRPIWPLAPLGEEEKFTHSVALAAGEIDFSGPWLVWAEEPDPLFMASLARMGQLSPVLVEKDGAGWSLIAGYKRVRALAELDRPVAALSVAAQEGKELSEAEKILIYLASNQDRGRSVLDTAMRIKALAGLRPHLADRELAEQAAPLLDCAPKSRVWRRLLAWLAMAGQHVSGFWNQAVIEGRADLAWAEELSRMSVDDRHALEPLFAELRWSRSAGAELIRDLYETSRARQTSLAALLKERSVEQALGADLGPKDAMQRILTAVRELRRPNITRLERRFKDLAQELRAERTWRVESSDSFETGGVRLGCRIGSREELHKAVQELSDMADSPQWDALWRLGQEAGDIEGTGEDGE